MVIPKVELKRYPKPIWWLFINRFKQTPFIRIEKVNDGKGRWILIGNNYGHKNVLVTFNGQVWLFNMEIGRIFSFTFWEKTGDS